MEPCTWLGDLANREKLTQFRHAHDNKPLSAVMIVAPDKRFAVSQDQSQGCHSPLAFCPNERALVYRILPLLPVMGENVQCIR